MLLHFGFDFLILGEILKLQMYQIIVLSLHPSFLVVKSLQQGQESGECQRQCGISARDGSGCQVKLVPAAISGSGSLIDIALI